MRLCSRHFADLRAALQKKGLWYLVELEPRHLAMRAQQWLDGNTTDETFDPFVAANMEIHVKAIELMGPEHNWKRNGSEPCPLCKLNQFLCNDNADLSWIDNITDMMVLVAITNNIPRKSVLTL